MSRPDRIIFDSVNELGRHVLDLDARPDDFPRAGRESTRKNDPDYYGMPMEHAIDKALAGGSWREGADAMPKIDLGNLSLSGAAMAEPLFCNQVQGFAPNVPAYLTGEPESMFNFEEVEQGDKLLKVAVHVGRANSVEQREALNRGAAIMAVLDQLTKEGYSLELWAIWRNKDSDGHASVETMIKGSQDFWSPESVAFALCNVAFQRRLCWRVGESLTDGGQNITYNGYGNGREATFPEFDLSYGYMSTDSKFSTPASAVREIKASTLQQLEKGA